MLEGYLLFAILMQYPDGMEETDLKFIYEPELLEYMKKKGKKDIIVELVSIDHSDIEMTDIHVYLANHKQVKLFKEEKKYKSVKTSAGEVLLPQYRLELDENVTFGLKSFWIFKSVKYTGIRL